MKILKTLSRVYVEDLEDNLYFYEKLLGIKVEMRIPMPDVGLELAQIDDILIIAGLYQALKPFKKTQATFLADSVEEYQKFLEKNGSEIKRGPQKAPTGINMTVEHPDGSIFEYVQHILE
jgi:predicted enzyme related to lactoylglutathione lyase